MAMTNEERKQVIAETVACLAHGWNMRKIGEINGSIILLDESRHNRLVPSYDWLYLCDNGGEFNVGTINKGSVVSVPYTDYHTVLDGGTMAYRVACAIRGDEIDYSFRLPEIVEDCRKAA
jgi:hypothetical protein